VNRKIKAALIRSILQKHFPHPKIPLDHSTPYTLLIAVLLSAQCTDKRVNEITPKLFSLAKTPYEMVKLSISLKTAVGPRKKAQDFDPGPLDAGVEHSQKVKATPASRGPGSKSCAFLPAPTAAFRISQIAAIIRPCGLCNMKAKAIWHLSKALIEKYNGKVPCSFKSLEALPGVGHKTASVVMAQAFGKPAFPVDTHIERCAHRWGLSRGRGVEKTEKDLKRLFAKKEWKRLHLQIILFARKYCKARGHTISSCPICKELGPATVQKGP